MPLFAGKPRSQGSLKAYKPGWAEWLGQQVGNALAPVMGNRGGARFGHRVQNFLTDLTPIGNLDAILYGNENERQIAMLPLPGPARKVPKLAMGEVSRLTRAVEQGYHDVPFYRGEARPGPMPTKYKETTAIPFSRDKEYADGFGRAGGHEGAREFRLKIDRPLNVGLKQDISLADYAAVLRGLIKNGDEAGAKHLSVAILDHRALPEHVFALAQEMPDHVVADGFNLYRLLEQNSADPSSALRSAGYDAIDFGTKEVHKLTPQGIRLKSARFDPRKINSTNINHGLAPAGAGLAGWSLYGDSPDEARRARRPASRKEK